MRCWDAGMLELGGRRKRKRSKEDRLAGKSQKGEEEGGSPEQRNSLTRHEMPNVFGTKLESGLSLWYT